MGQWIKASVFLGAWTAVGLLFSVQIYVDYLYAGRPIGWPQALFLALSEWYLWAALSPAILALARRFPIGRDSWFKSLAVHLPATLFFTLLKLAVHGPIVDLSGIGRIRDAGMQTFSISLLTCWMIVGASQALIHYRASQDRMQQALELEARLTRSQLQLLKAQLKPHFLFNTLHSIGTLMHRDVEAAETMLVKLSDHQGLIFAGKRDQTGLAKRQRFYHRVATRRKQQIDLPHERAETFRREVNENIFDSLGEPT